MKNGSDQECRGNDGTVDNGAARLACLLGGMTRRGRKMIAPTDWIFMLRNGFPFQALESFGQNINAADSELAGMLGVSVRTLARRRRKRILTRNESERLYRLARVIARAEEVFGHRENGLLWLKAPNTALGGHSPISLLDTGVGAELVTDLLGKIEYGIFS